MRILTPNLTEEQIDYLEKSEESKLYPSRSEFIRQIIVQYLKCLFLSDYIGDPIFVLECRERNKDLAKRKKNSGYYVPKIIKEMLNNE